MDYLPIGYVHAVQEVDGSNPSRGTIVGGNVQPSRISSLGEDVNYRPYVSPSFEVDKPRKITAISAIIIIIIIIIIISSSSSNSSSMTKVINCLKLQ